MRKMYVVRYERFDDFYSCLKVTAKDTDQAERRAKEYLDAEGLLWKRIDQVYLAETQEYDDE